MSSASGAVGKSREIAVSKLLSYLLRHGARKEGLKIGDDGYVELAVVLNHVQMRSKGVTAEEVTKIVETNDKRRFSLVQRGAGWFIKANQGHSLTEVNKLSLTEVLTVDHPVVHGTYYRNWVTIKVEGLKRMSRNHIHLAVTDVTTTGCQISGFRSNCDLLIYVDFPAARADGVRFYRSENNVILTEGIDGVLSPKYFLRVFDRNKLVDLLN